MSTTRHGGGSCSSGGCGGGSNWCNRCNRNPCACYVIGNGFNSCCNKCNVNPCCCPPINSCCNVCFKSPCCCKPVSNCCPINSCNKCFKSPCCCPPVSNCCPPPCGQCFQNPCCCQPFNPFWGGGGKCGGGNCGGCNRNPCCCGQPMYQSWGWGGGGGCGTCWQNPCCCPAPCPKPTPTCNPTSTETVLISVGAEDPFTVTITPVFRTNPPLTTTTITAVTADTVTDILSVSLRLPARTRCVQIVSSYTNEEGEPIVDTENMPIFNTTGSLCCDGDVLTPSSGIVTIELSIVPLAGNSITFSASYILG